MIDTYNVMMCFLLCLLAVLMLDLASAYMHPQSCDFLGLRTCIWGEQLHMNDVIETTHKTNYTGVWHIIS